MGSTLLPDYAGGGLVNLMQSIATACGSNDRRLSTNWRHSVRFTLGGARNILLLLVDGLGTEHADPARRCQPAPAAPPARQPDFGLSVDDRQRHHDSHERPRSGTARSHRLAHAPRRGGPDAGHPAVDPAREPPRVPPEQLPPQLFSHSRCSQELTRECWVVAPRSIAGSPFNAWHSRGAQVAAYATLPEMYSCLAELLLETASPRYIYAYYPELDSLSHHYGSDSRQAQRALAELDTGFAELLRNVRGSNSWLVVTADHGFIDSPAAAGHHARRSSAARRSPATPLCGERRVAYCYVAGRDRPAFEAYVRRHLARAVHLHASERLVAAGWFGPPPWHPRLRSRIGDYTLLMKDNWTIKDWLPGERHFAMLGVHGGISASEMRIPLIAAHA
jgi:hypothetical protein